MCIRQTRDWEVCLATRIFYPQTTEGISANILMSTLKSVRIYFWHILSNIIITSYDTQTWHYLISFTEQEPSRKAESRSATEEIPLLYEIESLFPYTQEPANKPFTEIVKSRLHPYTPFV
jgi:hypothetical protein